MFKGYNNVTIPETGELVGTGWLPPVPDMRDFTDEHAKVSPILKGVKFGSGGPAAPLLPHRWDNRDHCSPIENQGALGSCTANAAVGMIEYLQRRSFDHYLNGSRLFVYKTTRNLMGVIGDTGAYIRNTMGALVLCGVPPEVNWPYTTKTQPGPAGERTFDDEPPAFVYALGDNYEAKQYFCHDPVGSNRQTDVVLNSVKKYLAIGFPSMFGFYGFGSFDATDVPGGIPYPCRREKALWGHAVLAVGYDDKMKITNKTCNESTTGALIIRNSWGVGWGDKGYGYLPYRYVLDRLANDFWTCIKAEWVDTGKFGLG
jgi:C1A family cysteine protease